MTRLEKTKQYCKENSISNIDDLLELIQIEWDIYNTDKSQHNVNGWYGVSNHEGIIAYFGTEEEALFYRLSFINRILND